METCPWRPGTPERPGQHEPAGGPPGRPRSRRPRRVRLPGPGAKRARRRRGRRRRDASGAPPGEEACNGTRIVAYVGSEVILESDLILRKMDKKGTFEIIGSIDHVLDEYKGQYPPEQLDASGKC